MKIIHAVGWYFPESLGGTEVYVEGLSQRLSEAGHKVSIAAPDRTCIDERRYEHGGVSVYRYPIPNSPTRSECQNKSPLLGTELFHSWLREEQPDVVHFHSFVTGLGLSEIRAAKSAGARVIVTNHLPSLGFICQRGTLMRWGEKLCDGKCQTVKCAACELQQRGLAKPLAWAVGSVPLALSKVGNLLPGKIGTALGMSDLIARNKRMQRELINLVDKVVLLNEWALETFVANGAPRNKLSLNRLGLSQKNVRPKPGPDKQPTKTPIKVGYVGRLATIKGVHDLARAVSSLPIDVPINIEFRGPVNDSESRGVVEELQQIIKGDPRVEFAPPVPVSEVTKVMATYDIICCPSSSYDNGPTVVNEAHAVGTPVVGTRIGGMAEIIVDGVSGRLVEPQDWHALAEVLRETAFNPSGTIDRWRLALPVPRTMNQITADYMRLYEA